MIRRIEVYDEKYLQPIWFNWEGDEQLPDKASFKEKCKFGGGFFNGGLCPNVESPPKNFNKDGKCRGLFFFTEKGWDHAGRDMLAQAIQEAKENPSFHYRVLKLKNPPRSAIVFKDRYQIAVLRHWVLKYAR